MWSTEPDRYRGVPKAQARRIRQRDEDTCQQCGADGHDVDHITNVASGGTHDDNNLQTLCERCHKTKTQTEAFTNRRLRKRPTTPHPGLRGP